MRSAPQHFRFLKRVTVLHIYEVITVDLCAEIPRWLNGSRPPRFSPPAGSSVAVEGLRIFVRFRDARVFPDIKVSFNLFVGFANARGNLNEGFELGFFRFEVD